MIHVEYKENPNKGTVQVTMTGHAQSAPFGEDLICAGSSALAYTLMQNVIFAHEAEKFKRSPKIERKSGHMRVVVTPKEEHYNEVKTMFMTIMNGFLAIEYNFANRMSVRGIKHPEAKKVDFDLE